MSPENPAFDKVRTYAIKLRRTELNFNFEHIEAAPNVYVGWLDLMGAGHVMSNSIQKTANYLARLHIAVERARSAITFSGRLLPINDGIFIVSNSKKEIISLLGRAMIMLAANFVAIPRPRLLPESSIAPPDSASASASSVLIRQKAPLALALTTKSGLR